jgi:hypothetical protein
MISFDAVWFGYGAGLVMAGWIAGMLVGVALGILGKMGKLGCFLLVGFMCLCPFNESRADVSTATQGGLTPGLQYVCSVQLTASGDSMGSLYGGAGAVSYCVPGTTGTANYQVECQADSSGTATVVISGDASLTGAVVSCQEGSNGGRLLSFMAGVGCMVAFSIAAAGRFF